MNELSAEVLAEIAGRPLPAPNDQTPIRDPAERDFSEKALAGDEFSAGEIAEVARRACALAKRIQVRAVQLQTSAERRQQAELDRMLQHPEDKATLTQMTDQGFRSHNNERVVDQLIHILDVQGIPRFFSPLDRTLLRGFQSFGNYLPGVAVPLVKDKMRQETSNVILPAERDVLNEHLRQRREQGIRMNVNFLGEAVLGEEEAQRRLEKYLAALQQPEIEVVSVKISTLYSQISPLARDHTLAILCDRLELLYRAAARQRYQPQKGPAVSKFVYLDMEEYRDMSLTAAAFMTTLDRSGLEEVRAGIALQAYVPDSFVVQRQITQWAQRRVDQGKSPVTIRIVKGANMEMERVEASLRGWPLAPYHSKLETDANYKRMVLYGMQRRRIQAVHLGIATHNLFEVAFALILSTRWNVNDFVQFEMLEGMANHQRRALSELTSNLLLYAPACTERDFTSAIGYLVRRLDENTGEDNFLRHAFKITVDSPAWQKLQGLFLTSTEMVASISSSPRRQQDRNEAPLQPDPPTSWQQYVNEPDTDFALPQNGLWGASIASQWQDRCDQRASLVAVAIDGCDEAGEGELYQSFDPSRAGVVVARYRQASAAQLRIAIETAHRDRDGWRSLLPSERYAILRRAAQRLRERRADLIGAAMADGGKTILESDPEVSEAIDFVEFYARAALDLMQAHHHFGATTERVQTCCGLGIVVVISPWNFPIAIPCGGVAAALAAGNTVILKPASDTALPARLLCECFWEAGVSRSTLQFAPCSGQLAGEALVGDPRVNAVILTGGTATAQNILAAHPTLHLLAETGGKNATIVSSLSDHELAIKNVLHSAFSHSGQKCSATSLLLLEDEVYHDRGFRDALLDAAASLRVGSAWRLETKLGPLIRPPTGGLLRGLKELEFSETWALMPRMLEGNPCLYSPGIKWDVEPGNFTHMTELFGPVLAVMPYRHLNQAIQLVHQTGYGLTSGLESLDDREQALWSGRLSAGNLYINRPTTGAVVLRQPFGGLGKSSFGPGLKAGGPNYVVPLMRHPRLVEPLTPKIVQVNPVPADPIAVTANASASHSIPSDALRPLRPALADFWRDLNDGNSLHAVALRSQFSAEEWSALRVVVHEYDRFAAEEIADEHDTLRLVGQDNVRRYMPLTHLRIRVMPADRPLDILARVIALRAAGGRAAISAAPDVHHELMVNLEAVTRSWGAAVEFIEESDTQLVSSIAEGQVERLRYSCPENVPRLVRLAANQAFIYIGDTPVSPMGQIELLWNVREQSLSVDYHRYGNVGSRVGETRAIVS